MEKYSGMIDTVLLLDNYGKKARCSTSHFKGRVLRDR